LFFFDNSTKFIEGSIRGLKPDCSVRLDIYALEKGNAIAGALTLWKSETLNSFVISKSHLNTKEALKFISNSGSLRFNLNSTIIKFQTSSGNFYPKLI